MKNIGLYLLLLVIGMLGFQILPANALDTPVSCPSELSGKGCNLCFRAETVYEGDGKYQQDVAINAGVGVKDLYFQDELVAPITYNLIGPNATYRAGQFEFPSTSFLSNCTKNGVVGWCGDATIGFRTFLNPGEQKVWTQTTPGNHFQFVSLNKAGLTAQQILAMRNVAFMTKYTLSAWGINASTDEYISTTPQVVNECQFWGVGFCGDGVIDAGKEVCDPSDPSKTNFGSAGCNSSCQPINTVNTPRCDSLVATPLFGTSPFSSQVSCTGSNLGLNPVYSIDCGNGQVINSSTGTCSYTNLTNVSTTYTAACTITPQGGTPVGGPACVVNIGVNTGLSCTPGTTTGTQTAPVTATTPNLCPAGQAVGGFTAVQNPTTGVFTYTWSCNGSAVGGACTANYNPNLVAGIDLSLKKYVNVVTQDAQDGNPVALGTGTTFNYLLQVTNNGTDPVTGTTTVTDPGPVAGVDFVGTPSGSGWTCTTSGRAITCTTTAAIASGARFPVITVPATTTTAIGTFRNLATVANPNENPLNNFGNNNTDPANVTTTPVGPVCVPGTTTGAQTAPVTATTPNLCPAGQAVGGFAAVQAPVTGVFTYTWSCNGSAVGGACTATHNPTTNSGLCGTLTMVNTGPSLQIPVATTVTCTAGPNAGATPTFSIECGNGQTINGSTGTCNYPVVGTFNAVCRVNGELAANVIPACRATISPTNGGGGGPGTCSNLGFTVVSNINGVLGVNMNCQATAAAGPNPVFQIQCGNGQSIDAASGVCLYNTVGSGISFPYTAQCTVNGSTQGSPGLPGIPSVGSCRQSIGYSGGGGPPGGGGGGGGPYCGNGIIDRNDRVRQSPTIIPATPIEPWSCTANYTAAIPATATTPEVPPVFIDYTCRVNLGEECDAGSFNGSVIDNSVCSSTCRLKSPLNTDDPGFTNPAANPLTIDFVPASPTTVRARGPVGKFKWIVGDGVPVFDQGDRFMLASPFPTLLQGGTTKIRNNSQLLTGTSVSYVFGGGLRCVGSGKIDLGTGGVFNCPNEVQLFVAGSNGAMNGMAFNGNTSNMTPGDSADDVNKPTSVGSAVLQNNFAISVGYMNEPIFVRVSKPAISNTAGGNAFSAVQVGYNVNTIAGDFLSDLKKGNFTVTSNSTAISGIVDTTGSSTAATATGTIEAAGLASTGLPSGDLTVTTLSEILSNTTVLGRVGDMKNLYVLKKGNLTISGPGLILDGVGTILIEEGTLDIQTNISYANATSSWAFIVKKPNGGPTAIRVSADVKNIAGSFLALAGNMDGDTSANQLAIDGNVNANISRLVTARTFIKANESSSALTTGVTINYSTRAFKNPPPLLTQYIEQYNLAKISR